MDLYAELTFRVERLIEWNNFERILRPALTATSRLKNELDRHAPEGKIPDAAGWNAMRLVWNNWVVDEDGTLIDFIDNCQRINQPLNGRLPFDFRAKLNDFMLTSGEIVTALRDGSVAPLRAHSVTVETTVSLINRRRRYSHETELAELLTAVGRLQPVTVGNFGPAVPHAAHVAAAGSP